MEATLTGPGSLAELLGATGLRFVEYSDGAVGVPFRGERADEVVVTARELDSDLTLFLVSLPELGQRKELALESLLRVSFEADYVKALASPSGERLLAAELPSAALSPPICAGVIRGLAALGDVEEADLSHSEGWQERLLACAHAQASEIKIDVARARQEMRAALTAAGVAFEQLPSGSYAVPLKLSIFEGSGLARASEQAISLSVSFDFKPMRDKEAYMGRLLEMNLLARVAKVGLDSKGNVALLYEVPELMPDFVEQARAQFDGFARSVLALHHRVHQLESEDL